LFPRSNSKGTVNILLIQERCVSTLMSSLIASINMIGTVCVRDALELLSYNSYSYSLSLSI